MECLICDYSTSSKKDFNKHLRTAKHIKNANLEHLEQKIPKNPKFICDCGKIYKVRNSFWYHKRKCGHNEKNPPNSHKSNIVTQCKENDINYKDLLMKAMEQLQEQQKLMGQMVQNVGNNTTNNTTNNNHFNIHLFLNEQCKDAINFSDFIDRIEVSHDDLENSANSGFVNGITKILVDNLKQLTLYERPIHCTDVKRETIYIKDNDKWEKDQEQTTNKLNGAIREVSRKSLCSLMQWKQDNPDYEDGNSEFSNRCIMIQQQIMPGYNRDKYYPRVVHNLAKESAIEKKLI